MRTIALADIQADPSLYNEARTLLEEGGMLCYPAVSGYKLAVDVGSLNAVNALYQAKRRVKNAPALVLLPDATFADALASEISAPARQLMDAFWPGSLTLLFAAHEDIPNKIRKQLTKATGWLGLRVPGNDISHKVTGVFGKPLLVSSANLARKHGAHSLAQVKKNFGRTVDLLIDAGDIPVGPKSTLVDVTGDTPVIVREGAILEAEIQKILAPQQ